jgi:hypothetical protein
MIVLLDFIFLTVSTQKMHVYLMSNIVYYSSPVFQNVIRLYDPQGILISNCQNAQTVSEHAMPKNLRTI